MRRQLRVLAHTPLLALLFTLACASPIELVQPPERKADLFPTARRSGSLVVAVDAVNDVRRAERYFGFDPRAAGLMPAQVVITNLGKQPVDVDAADILVQKGREVVDPVPIARVAELCKQASGVGDDETGEQVDAHFAKLSFPSLSIAPGETVSGWLFFDVGPEEKAPENPWFRVVSLYDGGNALALRVAVTESDSGQRLHFGPFRLDR